MYTRILASALSLAVIVALAGCASTDASDQDGSPDVSAPGDVSGDAGEIRLANGLYDQDDGSVMALGVLEQVDLEGGFYAITGSPEGEDNIAVIANADEFAEELQAYLGSTVLVTGTRFDGASIRMAGPEIVIESIEQVDDTPGAAE